MRGKHRFTSIQHTGVRITPACAGKTVPFVKQRKCKEDHPRVCGENQTCDDLCTHNQGSPPRVRGKPRRTEQGVRHGRITPACAGKTYELFGFCAFSQDHPRVCGENSPNFAHRLPLQGSPPRVRGKRNMLEFPIGLFRITPACAGKTSINFVTTAVDWDHPRVCGENKIDVTLRYRDQGSPPRVRGKLKDTPAAPLPERITPACAGKT